MALITQYNPNGVFIAIEELGYVIIALALLCPARSAPTRSDQDAFARSPG